MDSISVLARIFPSVRLLKQTADKVIDDKISLLNKKLELEQRLDNELKKVHRCTPQTIFSQLFNNGFSWYDFNDLSPESKINYYKNAQAILDNPVLTNVKNFLIATCTQESFLTEDKSKDQIRDMQMTINGIELLIDHLQNVPNPQAENSMKADDPFADI